MEPNKYGITYHKEGDYYYPDLCLPETPEFEIGRYGRMHLKFIKENRRVLYQQLLTSCKLPEYLAEIDETARDRIDRLTKQIAKRNGATESLKNSDPLKWAGIVNNAKHCAEEIVLPELIYD